MATITYLTRIEFDHGVVATLPELLAGLGVKAPLLVTDRGVIAAGLLDRVRADFPDATVFADTPANPTEAAAVAALDLYRSAGCDGFLEVPRSELRPARAPEATGASPTPGRICQLGPIDR